MKNNSEIIVIGMEAIDTFLSNWKEEAIKYYLDMREEYIEKNIAKETLFPTITYKDGYTDSPYRQLQSYMMNKYGKGNFLTMKDCYYYIEDKFLADLDKVLDKEVTRKKTKLINDITKKAGEIVNVIRLGFGDDGLSLDGIIEGDKAKVAIKTIGAGGYNVQCFHYRTKVTIIL